MRKSFAGIAALSAVLMLSGCASYIEGGPLIRPGEATGTIRLVNTNRLPITVVLVSNCNHSTYGLNRLPQNTAIPVNGSYDFTVSAGCWDISAGTATGPSSYTEGRKRIEVRAGGVTTVRSYDAN